MSLEYKDLVGLVKNSIHIDEFASKMGDDADVIVISFYVRDRQASEDLMHWFEKGYDWILDADASPGELKPNRYLVYIELRRRTAAARHIQELLSDLNTLTEFEPNEWSMVYRGQDMPYTSEAFETLVPLSPHTYRAETDEPLNEMRIASGLAPKPVHASNAADIRALKAAAGL